MPELSFYYRRRPFLLGLSDVDGVYHADDRGIYGTVLVAFGETGRRSADDDDLLVKACPYGIHRDDITALVRAVEVDRLYDEEFLAVQAFVFLRRDDRAENASNYHLIVDRCSWFVVGKRSRPLRMQR